MTTVKQYCKMVSWLSIAAISALLIACTSSEDNNGNVTHDGKNLLVHFTTPKALIGPLIIDLKANVAVGDASPIDLIVNPDNTISGTINNVSPGNYDLVITYYVVLNFLQTSLATVTKQITVVAGAVTSVMIDDNDLNKNIDSDKDGYTNLSELNIGTDPNDKNDAPKGELLLYSLANGSFGEGVSSGKNSNRFNIKSRLGEPLNGTKKSSRFALVSGFRAY